VVAGDAVVVIGNQKMKNENNLLFIFIYIPTTTAKMNICEQMLQMKIENTIHALVLTNGKQWVLTEMCPSLRSMQDIKIKHDL